MATLTLYFKVREQILKVKTSGDQGLQAENRQGGGKRLIEATSSRWRVPVGTTFENVLGNAIVLLALN